MDKRLHDSIISQRWEDWAHKVNLTKTPFLIEIPVSGQDSHIFVLGVSIWPLSTIFLLTFRTTFPTVWYFVFSLDLAYHLTDTISQLHDSNKRQTHKWNLSIVDVLLHAIKDTNALALLCVRIWVCLLGKRLLTEWISLYDMWWFRMFFVVVCVFQFILSISMTLSWICTNRELTLKITNLSSMCKDIFCKNHFCCFLKIVCILKTYIKHLNHCQFGSRYCWHMVRVDIKRISINKRAQWRSKHTITKHGLINTLCFGIIPKDVNKI